MNIFKQTKEFVKRDILLNLLSKIDENKIFSQKNYANSVGVAVGLINIYIKKCIKKGYIKIKNVPNRRYVYYLTPKGFKEKSRLVTQYLGDSFNFFIKAKKDFQIIFNNCKKKKIRNIAIVGDGELVEIALLVAKSNSFSIKFIFSNKITKKELLDVKITNSLELMSKVDAIIIADNEPQKVYNFFKTKLKKKFHFFSPSFLKIKLR